MADPVRLADYRRGRQRVRFTQAELRQLLDVYSRRVARGTWRDYAIDHQPGMAVFSIFRHTRDVPLYRVAKLEGGGRGVEYLVVSGLERLKRGTSLPDVLGVFDQTLELVS